MWVCLRTSYTDGCINNSAVETKQFTILMSIAVRSRLTIASNFSICLKQSSLNSIRVFEVRPFTQHSRKFTISSSGGHRTMKCRTIKWLWGFVNCSRYFRNHRWTMPYFNACGPQARFAHQPPTRRQAGHASDTFSTSWMLTAFCRVGHIVITVLIPRGGVGESSNACKG